MEQKLHFQVPSIPQIFVPRPPVRKSPVRQSEPKEPILNDSSEPKPCQVSDDQKKTQDSSEKANITKDGKEFNLPADLNKLCSPCSKILMSYFKPLQSYINEVVEAVEQNSGSSVIESEALQQNTKDQVTNLKSNRSLTQPNNEPNRDVFNRGSDVPETNNFSNGQNISSGQNSQIQVNQQSNSSEVQRGSDTTLNIVDGATNVAGQTLPSDLASINLTFDTNNPDLQIFQNTQNIKELNLCPMHQNFPEKAFDRLQLNSALSTQTNRFTNPQPDLVSSVHSPSERQSSESFARQSSASTKTCQLCQINNDNLFVNNSETQLQDFTQQMHPSNKEENFGEIFTEKVENINKDVSASGHISTNQNAGLFTIETSGNFSNDSNRQLKNVEESFDKISSPVEPEVVESPFAYVTIAYNNLSATNAIILANSIRLTHNKTLLMGNKESLGKQQVVDIPIVVLVGGQIEHGLEKAFSTVFDVIIPIPTDAKASLLNDEAIGLTQYKIHLWKTMIPYKKCLFLEPSTLVIGQVTNLFEECEEFSACVDWLFPDNFNCAVFVFEPNLQTYYNILDYAIHLQRQDENLEPVDEMSVLNKFFASKWKKLSFVYNFTPNSAIYTQQPAFMKFGGNIRIINFGSVVISSALNTSSGFTQTEPWHITFDLLASSYAENDIVTEANINNYVKFYLSLFLKRLWPLIQQGLSPILMTKHIGRKNWTIFELIRLLSDSVNNKLDNYNMFSQTPTTLRRKKSTQEKIQQINETLLSPTIPDKDAPVEIANFLLSKEVHATLPIEENVVEPKQGSDLIRDECSSSIEQQIETQNNAAVDPYSGMREWESGRIDWMGVHGSDRLIERLKNMIRTD